MGKRRGFFGFGRRKHHGGEEMPLPVLGTAMTAARVIGIGRRVLRHRKGIGAAAGALAGVAGLAGHFGHRRRRRHGGISMNEMGKLMFLSQILGKRSPAVTFIAMKAVGGRI